MLQLIAPLFVLTAVAAEPPAAEFDRVLGDAGGEWSALGDGRWVAHVTHHFSNGAGTTHREQLLFARVRGEALVMILALDLGGYDAAPSGWPGDWRRDQLDVTRDAEGRIVLTRATCEGEGPRPTSAPPFARPPVELPSGVWEWTGAKPRRVGDVAARVCTAPLD